MSNIEDTIVNIQREKWLKEIEKLKKLEGEHVITVSTHKATDTPVIEEKSSIDLHLFTYLAAHNDDDAPDGAWWAKLEDGVRFYNEQFCLQLDPFDTVHAYINQCQENES